MTPKIDDLIIQLNNARRELNAAMEKVPPQMDIYPSWKLKQLMDHITGWDELMVSAYRTYSQEADPEMVVKHGIDQYNVESVRARVQLSLEESRAAFEAARVEVLKALNEIPAEKMTQKFQAPWGGNCTIASALKIFISHELEHAKQIEEALSCSTKSN